MSPHIVTLLPLILRILCSTSWFVFLLKRTTSYFLSLVGKVIYSYDGRDIGSVDITASESVKKATFADALGLCFRSFFS